MKCLICGGKSSGFVCLSCQEIGQATIQRGYNRHVENTTAAIQRSMDRRASCSEERLTVFTL